MPRFKLLSFFCRSKKQERWYDFKIHKFCKKPQTMWRLSFALNYIPIHGPGKYRSYLFQAWHDDREWLEDRFEWLFERFIGLVGADLGSRAYAEENAVLGIERFAEVEYNVDLIGETRFEVEHH